MALVLGSTLLLAAGSAHAQPGGKGFDHTRTGFVLDGAHARERCESCHANGVFKGTPRDCASCHTSGSALSRNNVVKDNSTHIPTTAGCETCHTAQTFTGTRFSHAGVMPGACTTCHNGRFAKGKSANHFVTTASCDTCHIVGNFAAVSGGARPSHAGFNTATNCSTCHNGTTASGKQLNHIPTTANCITCHTATASTWKPSVWNHTQQAVAKQCATCHSGNFAPADGKPVNHINYASVAGATSANCDSCHKSGFVSWNPGRFHANFTVATNCAGCHKAGALGATQQPNTAIHANAPVCETCHNVTAWSSAAGVRPNHSTFTAATDCSSCHNGTAASGKTVTHIPTTANCVACHTATAATWKPTLWNHTQQAVAGQCATCHNGSFAPADGKPGNHISYASIAGASSANCDSCHKSGYVSWNPGTFHTNFSVTTNCAGCHNSGALGATQKPNTATHATVTVCESCHKDVRNWLTGVTAGGRPTHDATGVGGQPCANCHNGSTASGKTLTHVPTTLNCVACHTATAATWKPSTFNHANPGLIVAGQCAACHTGGFAPADGKPTTHINYSAYPSAANCDSCHKSGFLSWNPGRFHANVSGVVNNCSTCHNSGALGATQKPATPIHTGVTTCETCHTTTNWTVVGKPSHAAFTAATVCTTCHGVSASGKLPTHIPTVANCITCHSATAATWKPTLWNHTQQVVAAQCSTCHSGAFPPADGKPATHINYSGFPTATNCDSCHKAGYVSWNPGKFHSNVTGVAANCATCHNAGALGATQRPNTVIHNGATVCESCHKSTASWTAATKVDHATFTVATVCSTCHNGSVATGKTATHIPVGVANCGACHSIGTVWKPSKFNHTQVPVTAQCSTCHTGTYPPADGKPATHIPYSNIAGATTANCDSCHKAGYTSWAGGKLHASVTVTGQCKTCHSGTYTAWGAQAKPTNHIPETQLLNGGAMECNACHTSTTVWTTVTMNHNNTPGNGAGSCKACHATGTAWLGNMQKKAVTHQSKTATDCSQSGCHRPLGNQGTLYRSW